MASVTAVVLPGELRCFILFLKRYPELLSHWNINFHCYFLTGTYGPEHWVTSSEKCGGSHQSPIDIVDHQAHVGDEYQELQLDGFDNESSNKTWMKNTGKTGMFFSVCLHSVPAVN